MAKEPVEAGADARWYYEDGHWIALEQSRKHVRVVFAGVTIADSQRVLLLRERGRRPRYFFPRTDVRTEYLKNSRQNGETRHLGATRVWDVVVGDSKMSRSAQAAALAHPSPTPQAKALAGHIGFDWKAMDAWFEEDEQVLAAPRDPYVRIDCLKSSRHVEVFMSGEKVADCHRPVLLFETGLPVRYYLPREDVRLELLKHSATETVCPYKGSASYFTLKIGEREYPDLIWTYLAPFDECVKIQELLCFYHERVEQFIVDGERVI